jgi:hypothetical protein
MGRGAHFLLAGSTLAWAVAASASETTTYAYDALGRLTATSSSGTVNNGSATSVTYDPAGNRSGYTVTGAAPPPPSPPPAASPLPEPSVLGGGDDRSGGALPASSPTPAPGRPKGQG